MVLMLFMNLYRLIFFSLHFQSLHAIEYYTNSQELLIKWTGGKIMKYVTMITALTIAILLATGCGDDNVQPSNSYTSPRPVVGPTKTIDVPGDYSIIQAAINAANSGDFIRVAAGVYTEHIIVIDKALSLRGAGSGQTIIVGSVSITNSSEASFEGFTVKEGRMNVIKSQARISGNEILNSPGPGWHIENCLGSIISDNTITSSTNEGILVDESNGVIGTNIVKDNGTDGIVVNNASPTLQHNIVTGNQRDGIAIRGFTHYTAPLLLQNEVLNNGGGSNYDIICFGDNTNPTGTGNLFNDCLNCAECRALGGPATYRD